MSARKGKRHSCVVDRSSSRPARSYFSAPSIYSQLAVIVDVQLLLAPRRGVRNVELLFGSDNGGRKRERVVSREVRSIPSSSLAAADGGDGCPPLSASRFHQAPLPHSPLISRANCARSILGGAVRSSKVHGEKHEPSCRLSGFCGEGGRDEEKEESEEREEHERGERERKNSLVVVVDLFSPSSSFSPPEERETLRARCLISSLPL